MSRIQEILAKAEREGTVRRTQTTEGLVPPAPVAFPQQPAHSAGPAQSAATPRVDGSSALDPFAPAAAVSPVAAPIAPVTPSIAAVASQAGPISEPRTAIATLHPLLVAAINPHSPVAEQYRTLR